jgi:hypothetical protein
MADTEIVTPEASAEFEPKVKLPAGALTAIGVVLLVLGLLIGEDNVTAAGVALLAGGPLAGLIGFLTRPGAVVIGPQTTDVASDALLHEQLDPEQRERLASGDRE